MHLFFILRVRRGVARCTRLPPLRSCYPPAQLVVSAALSTLLQDLEGILPLRLADCVELLKCLADVVCRHAGVFELSPCTTRTLDLLQSEFYG